MAAEPTPPSNKSPNPQNPLSKMDRGLPPWSLWVIVGIVLLALFASTRIDTTAGDKIEYSQFLAKVQAGEVKSATWDNSTTKITGETDPNQVNARKKSCVPSQCDKRKADNAVYCSCRCANGYGKTDDGFKYCTCPDGFTGAHCESPIDCGAPSAPTNTGYVLPFCQSFGRAT